MIVKNVGFFNNFHFQNFRCFTHSKSHTHICTQSCFTTAESKSGFNPVYYTRSKVNEGEIA